MLWFDVTPGMRALHDKVSLGQLEVLVPYVVVLVLLVWAYVTALLEVVARVSTGGHPYLPYGLVGLARVASLRLLGGVMEDLLPLARELL